LFLTAEEPKEEDYALLVFKKRKRTVKIAEVLGDMETTHAEAGAEQEIKATPVPLSSPTKVTQASQPKRSKYLIFNLTFFVNFRVYLVN